VFFVLRVAKADVEARLYSAQAALMLQEEAIRHGDREHKQSLDKLRSLEQTVSALEFDKRQLQVILTDGTNVFCSLVQVAVIN